MTGTTMDDMDRYFVCAYDEGLGADVYNPVTFDDEGNASIVSGLMLGLSRETIIERGAERIWRVDDLYDYANPRLEWEREPEGGEAK